MLIQRYGIDTNPLMFNSSGICSKKICTLWLAENLLQFMLQHPHLVDFYFTISTYIVQSTATHAPTATPSGFPPHNYQLVTKSLCLPLLFWGCFVLAEQISQRISKTISERISRQNIKKSFEQIFEISP